MSLMQRVARHVRLSARAVHHRHGHTPPFMVLFINSICNLTCEHCFYWRNLNRRDDLTLDEFKRLSLELGRIENLNLSGGEPFLREEFAEICLLFIAHNSVQEVYVPTNGFFPSRTERHVRQVLAADSFRLFACEISLDGMPEYHNRFRGNPRSFEKAMETYDMLAEIQQRDARLRIHAVSTATHENLDEIRSLTEYLHQRCPAMDHHNLAIIRGDRKNAELRRPSLDEYSLLYRHVAKTWRDRERGRYGSSVEPMLQWAKQKTIACNSQYVPCTAGRMTGVIYSNGDVSVCETHPPLGNLRQQSFFEIWDSEDADRLRNAIRAKQCHCTYEVSLWPSIVYQPLQLFKAMLGAKAYRAGS